MDKDDKERNWTVREVLDAMSKPPYPEYILKALDQIGLWMNECLKGDFRADYDGLYSQLDWMREHGDFFSDSMEQRPGGSSEAVILSLDGDEQDEALRLAIDHAAVFNAGKCQRVWIISDSWLPSEIFRYGNHIKALEARGISIRFILATPAGWTEIPLQTDGKSKGPLGWNDGATGVAGNDFDRDSKK